MNHPYGFKPLNAQQDQDSESKSPSIFSGWELGRIILGIVLFILGLLGIVLAFYLVIVIIGFIGEGSKSMFTDFRYMFHNARHAFHSARGFSAFIQLILIAGFIGWIINRFKK